MGTDAALTRKRDVSRLEPGREGVGQTVSSMQASWELSFTLR